MSSTSTDAGIVDLPDRVLEVARQDPERAAVIHVGRRGNRVTTYRELSHRAESLALGLREIGVAEGTKCSFMVPPGEDAMVLGIALWRVGAVMVGIEPHSHGLRKVARCLDRVGPEVFFGTPEAHVARRAFGWGRGTVRTDIVVGGPALPRVTTLASLERPWLGDTRPPDVTPDDPAIIAFTTGSTGDPKPTVMTHRNLTAMIDRVSKQWGLADGGEVIDMPTFPMFWIVGLSHGGTVVVPPMDFATKGVVVHDLATGRDQSHPNADLQHLYCIGATPDGKWYLSTVHAGMGFAHGILAIQAQGSQVFNLKIPGCRSDVSPDGKRIAWASGDYSLAIGELDFSGPERRVVNPHDILVSPKPMKIQHIDWSPDGRYVAFSRGPYKKGLGLAPSLIGIQAPGWDICVGDPSTTNRWVAITTDGKSNKEPDWAPVAVDRHGIAGGP